MVVLTEVTISYFHATKNDLDLNLLIIVRVIFMTLAEPVSSSDGLSIG